jgi:methylmalonyl-CoA mutase C-terminal domain/subunit
MSRRARVVIGMLGLDQHEMGARAVATMLRDAGMEVVYLGKFNTPARLVGASIEEDADVIGVSAHSWEYLEQVPELIGALAAASVEIPVVVGGSVVTDQDAQTLKAAGVAEVFGAGAGADDIVRRIQELSAARRS